jgi:hypothetical protein
VAVAGLCSVQPRAAGGPHDDLGELAARDGIAGPVVGPARAVTGFGGAGLGVAVAAAVAAAEAARRRRFAIAEERAAARVVGALSPVGRVLLSYAPAPLSAPVAALAAVGN